MSESGTPRASIVAVIPVVKFGAGGGEGGDLPPRHDKPSPGYYVLLTKIPTSIQTMAVNDNKDDKTIVNVVFWELILVEFHFVISFIQDESEEGGSGITGREEGGGVDDGTYRRDTISPAPATTSC